MRRTVRTSIAASVIALVAALLPALTVSAPAQAATNNIGYMTTDSRPGGALSGVVRWGGCGPITIDYDMVDLENDSYAAISWFRVTPCGGTPYWTWDTLAFYGVGTHSTFTATNATGVLVEVCLNNLDQPIGRDHAAFCSHTDRDPTTARP